MKYGIYDCSAQAKARIDPAIDVEALTPSTSAKKTKYGLELLKVGQAIAVPFDDVKEGSLRTLVAKQATQLKRKLTVLIHNDARVYEVARIG